MVNVFPGQQPIPSPRPTPPQVKAGQQVSYQRTRGRDAEPAIITNVNSDGTVDLHVLVPTHKGIEFGPDAGAGTWRMP